MFTNIVCSNKFVYTPGDGNVKKTDFGKSFRMIASVAVNNNLFFYKYYISVLFTLKLLIANKKLSTVLNKTQCSGIKSILKCHSLTSWV